MLSNRLVRDEVNDFSLVDFTSVRNLDKIRKTRWIDASDTFSKQIITKIRLFIQFTENTLGIVELFRRLDKFQGYFDHIIARKLEP